MPISPSAVTGLGAAAAIIPSVFSFVEGIGQRRQAKRIREKAVNPGYEQNTGVLQNEETLRNRYGNYEMPGYNQAKNNIGASSATAFNSGMQGASSSSDVLDLATKIAYGTGQQYRALENQNAQGKDAALGDYLNANVAAGEERQNVNAYDRQQYERQLEEAAALYNSGGQNINSAITGASSAVTSTLLNPSRVTKTTIGKEMGNPVLTPATSISGQGITNTIGQQPFGASTMGQKYGNPLLEPVTDLGVAGTTRPLRRTPYNGKGI